MADAQPTNTVGQLLDRLRGFDRDALVQVQDSLTDTYSWILAPTLKRDGSGTVVLVAISVPEDTPGETEAE